MFSKCLEWAEILQISKLLIWINPHAQTNL